MQFTIQVEAMLGWLSIGEGLKYRLFYVITSLLTNSIVL
jgi:hypothetical protein